MTNAIYTHPITIRYADLDSHGHVNNAVALSYLESARLGFYQAVGIWYPSPTMHTGMVVAHIDIGYLMPILFTDQIQVRLELARIGNKSFTLAFTIETIAEHTPLARGSTVMVAYDNKTKASIPIPEDWREKLLLFKHSKGLQ